MTLSPEQRAVALRLLNDLERGEAPDNDALITRVRNLQNLLNPQQVIAQRALEMLAARLEMMHFQLCADQRLEAMRSELRQTLLRLMDGVADA